MQKAKRLEPLKPSPTLLLSQQASELKAKGIDVLSLTAGEPDFPTPKWVCDAAKKAMDDGQTKYTPVGGTPELKQAIISKFARDNNLDYTANEVMAGTGGKQILFNALLATVNPGDEVVFQSPYWVSYPPMVEIAEGKPVVVETTPVTNYKMTARMLERAITPKTKWVILNSPSNPTGAVYSYEELFEIAQILRQNPHVLVLSDDIYEHITYDVPFNTIAAVEPELKSRTLIVNGVSKAYSMTGWRIGVGAGPEWLIKSMTTLQSQSTSNPCSIAQAAAVAAFNGDHRFLAEWRNAFKTRLEIIQEAVNTSFRHISLVVPDGAFYAFLNVSKLLGGKIPSEDRLNDDAAVAAYFLDEARVATVPGSAFGAPGHLRISFATSNEIVKAAMERIAETEAKITI